VIQAVRDCAEDLGRPPTITDYLAWQRRPDVRDRPGRRPASTWTFNRIFGGFPPARVAAGLVEGEPTAAHPSDLILRTANYRLSRNQILSDMREVAQRVGVHVTATVYDRERRLIYQETKAQGRPRAIAGVGSIYRHFGNWRAALRDARLDTADPPPRGPRWTNHQIVCALRNAYATAPPPLTESRYMDWRTHQAQPQPSYLTAWRRFGSFAAALHAAGIDLESATHVGRFSNEQLLEAVQEAMAATTASLSTSRYEASREAHSDGDPALRRNLPTYTTILKRFGSWPDALRLAREWKANA
jgi:hypothetical protein